MAVVIRMKRTGRRNRPCYRISVADRSFPRDGRTLETLGVYDPASPKPELRLKLDVERARHWISVGAQPSDTVRSILKREGVYGDEAPAISSVPKTRKRTGRGKTTAKRTRRLADQGKRAEAKSARLAVRVEAKKAVALAAAAAKAAEAEGS
jgi:small subunit ribosomal protein S16